MAAEQAEAREAWRYWLVVMFVSMFGLTVGNVFYSNYVSHHASAQVAAQATKQVQVFCAFFGTLDTGFAANPPTSPIAKLLAAEAHQLVEQLNCPTP